ncbi:MAG TPA: type II secretion system protein GspJ [Gammaproteobacteria bacterium]|jgi:general secretion pathway protein J|nr:type II secretion system protein GspJ [Gammaproteobacteria bacterium]
MRSSNKTLGFTLVEILVALLVFAVVGLLSTRLLSQSIDNQNNLQDRGQRLAEIHRAMRVLQRDIVQLSRRKIRDAQGEELPALIVSDQGAIEFSRVGWRNPLRQPRSEVQRVGYRWQDEKIIRGYWLTLDRSYDAEPAYQTLLENVEAIEFFAVDQLGNEHKQWPLDPEANVVTEEGEALYLAAILVRAEIAPYGMIERIWQVPSV